MNEKSEAKILIFEKPAFIAKSKAHIVTVPLPELSFKILFVEEIFSA
ncbi:MAG: hypothetical protein PUD33_01585 [Treponema sp.]|nr:hypothetical protein [Treponema sp.]